MLPSSNNWVKTTNACLCRWSFSSFGSGAVIGGLLVGLIEAFGGAYISTTYQLVIIYVVLVFFLMFRPQGIFGTRIQEKA